MASELRAHGFSIVGPVATIKQANELIRRDRHITCAIVDLDLGGTKAYPVADSLIDHRIPFIFASGFDKWVVPERFRHITLCLKPNRGPAIIKALLGALTRIGAKESADEG